MDDVTGYTLAQVNAFVGAIGRAQRRQALEAAIAARMAQADGKAWKRYVQALEAP
jgi:hypothetical protein